MKSHSFVRNTLPGVIHYSDRLHLPSFSSYARFLFLPTLIYQKNYPLRKKINWKFFFKTLVEFVVGIFILSFRFEKGSSFIQETGLRKFTVTEIMQDFVENSTEVAFLIMIVHYVCLHCIQNLFGELFRFGDRLFYTNWWDLLDLNTSLVKWNLIVAQWIYYYVYLDFKNYVRDNVFAIRLVSFVLSFVVHEWLGYHLWNTTCPLLFIFFIFIVFPTFYFEVPDRNVFVILNTYLIASGPALAVLYGVEYYISINVPFDNRSRLEQMFLPRFINYITWE